MTSGEIYMGEVTENIEDSKYISIIKPYSLMPVQGGFAVAPADIALLSSDSIENIQLNASGIQYYSKLENYPAHYDSYKQQTQTILGVEKKIIL